MLGIRVTDNAKINRIRRRRLGRIHHDPGRIRCGTRRAPDRRIYRACAHSH